MIIKKSKNQLAAIKRNQDPNYRKKISESMKKVTNSKEYIEKRIKRLQDKLKTLSQSKVDLIVRLII